MAQSKAVSKKIGKKAKISNRETVQTAGGNIVLVRKAQTNPVVLTAPASTASNAPLGPGTLILANGSILPVVVPPPKPVFVLQRPQTYPLLVQKPTSVRRTILDTTTTTFANKVPIPALTSKHLPNRAISQINLSNKNCSSKTSTSRNCIEKHKGETKNNQGKQISQKKCKDKCIEKKETVDKVKTSVSNIEFSANFKDNGITLTPGSHSDENCNVQDDSEVNNISNVAVNSETEDPSNVIFGNSETNVTIKTFDLSSKRKLEESLEINCNKKSKIDTLLDNGQDLQVDESAEKPACDLKTTSEHYAENTSNVSKVSLTSASAQLVPYSIDSLCNIRPPASVIEKHENHSSIMSDSQHKSAGNEEAAEQMKNYSDSTKNPENKNFEDNPIVSRKEIQDSLEIISDADTNLSTTKNDSFEKGEKKLPSTEFSSKDNCCGNNDDDKSKDSLNKIQTQSSVTTTSVKSQNCCSKLEDKSTASDNVWLDKTVGHILDTMPSNKLTDNIFHTHELWRVDIQGNKSNETEHSDLPETEKTFTDLVSNIQPCQNSTVGQKRCDLNENSLKLDKGNIPQRSDKEIVHVSSIKVTDSAVGFPNEYGSVLKFNNCSNAIDVHSERSHHERPDKTIACTLTSLESDKNSPKMSKLTQSSLKEFESSSLKTVECPTSYGISMPSSCSTFMPITGPGDPELGQFSTDLFASLHVPPGGHSSESISPTAAFLLAFPLVSTSKVSDMIVEATEDSMHGTSTLLQIGNIDATEFTRALTKTPDKVKEIEMKNINKLGANNSSSLLHVDSITQGSGFPEDYALQSSGKNKSEKSSKNSDSMRVKNWTIPNETIDSTAEKLLNGTIKNPNRSIGTQVYSDDRSLDVKSSQVIGVTLHKSNDTCGVPANAILPKEHINLSLAPSTEMQSASFKTPNNNFPFVYESYNTIRKFNDGKDVKSILNNNEMFHNSYSYSEACPSEIFEKNNGTKKSVEDNTQMKLPPIKENQQTSESNASLLPQLANFISGTEEKTLFNSVNFSGQHNTPELKSNDMNNESYKGQLSIKQNTEQLKSTDLTRKPPSCSLGKIDLSTGQSAMAVNPFANISSNEYPGYSVTDEAKSVAISSFSLAHNSSNLGILSWSTMPPMTAVSNMHQFENFSVSKSGSANINNSSCTSKVVNEGVDMEIPLSNINKTNNQINKNNMHKSVPDCAPNYSFATTCDNRISVNLETSAPVHSLHPVVSTSQHENFKSSSVVLNVRNQSFVESKPSSNTIRPPVNWMTTPDVRSNLSSIFPTSHSMTVSDIRNLPTVSPVLFAPTSSGHVSSAPDISNNLPPITASLFPMTSSTNVLTTHSVSQNLPPHSSAPALQNNMQTMTPALFSVSSGQTVVDHGNTNNLAPVASLFTSSSDSRNTVNKSLFPTSSHSQMMTTSVVQNSLPIASSAASDIRPNLPALTSGRHVVATHDQSVSLPSLPPPSLFPTSQSQVNHSVTGSDIRNNLPTVPTTLFPTTSSTCPTISSVTTNKDFEYCSNSTRVNSNMFTNNASSSILSYDSRNYSSDAFYSNSNISRSHSIPYQESVPQQNMCNTSKQADSYSLPWASGKLQQSETYPLPAWTPRKESYVPSTLPTLVGDLALGPSGPPPVVTDDRMCSKSTVDKQKTYSSFLSVSQLVDQQQAKGAPSRVGRRRQRERKGGACFAGSWQKQQTNYKAPVSSYSAEALIGPSTGMSQDKMTSDKFCQNYNHASQSRSLPISHTYNSEAVLPSNYFTSVDSSTSLQHDTPNQHDFNQPPYTNSSFNYNPSSSVPTSQSSNMYSSSYNVTNGSSSSILPEMGGSFSEPFLLPTGNKPKCNGRGTRVRGNQPCSKQQPPRGTRRRGNENGLVDLGLLAMGSPILPDEHSYRPPSPAVGGNSLANFNLSTIFPEINDKV